MNTPLRLRSFLYFMLTALIFLASIPAAAGDKPVLYGKILLRTSSGFEKPLVRAKIELLEVDSTKERKPPKVLFDTYTSNKGYFTFFRIPKGEYHLRVSLGKKTFFQLQDDKKVDVSCVEVSDPHITRTLPDIIVLQ